MRRLFFLVSGGQSEHLANHIGLPLDAGLHVVNMVVLDRSDHFNSLERRFGRIE